MAPRSCRAIRVLAAKAQAKVSGAQSVSYKLGYAAATPSLPAVTRVCSLDSPQLVALPPYWPRCGY